MWLKCVTWAALLIALQPIANASDAEAIIKKHGCAACHAVEKKMVGPSYQEIAKKYAGDANAPAALTQKVLNGSAGVWGQIPMPPHKGRVSEAEAAAAVRHMLATK